jgi:(1->4)-alpha-D-glucan 1-alpha-D-glucosylmutase
VYQGNEVWDFSLVDPDNRRPVDFELRKRLLADLRRLDLSDARALLKDGSWQDGRPKLYLIWKALEMRRHARGHPNSSNLTRCENCCRRYVETEP